MRVTDSAMWEESVEEANEAILFPLQIRFGPLTC